MSASHSSVPKELLCKERNDDYSDSRLCDPLNIWVHKCSMALFQAVHSLVAEADWQEKNAFLFPNFWPAVSSPAARKFSVYPKWLHYYVKSI